MNRPLEIRDVENISLEASGDNSDMYPQLVAQFTCPYEADTDCIHKRIRIAGKYNDKVNGHAVKLYIHACCSAIRMSNVTNAAIEGIGVTIKKPKVSAVILQQCSRLKIQSISYSCFKEKYYRYSKNELLKEFGIIAHESSDLVIDSLEACNFTIGIILYRSSNTTLVDVSAAHNEFGGIGLHYSTDTSMTNVSAEHNDYVGICMRYSSNTTMMNVLAAYNQNSGISLYYFTDASIMNVSAASNNQGGINLCYSTNTTMINVSASNNQDGINLCYSTNTTLMNVLAGHNEYDGIGLYTSMDTSIMNVSVVSNKRYGIHLVNTINTSMMDISAAHNENGIYMYRCTNSSIMNVLAAYNNDNGIFSCVITNTSIMNVSAAHNKRNGITLQKCTNTSMMNASGTHSGLNGINFYECTNTSMMNLSAANNTGGVALSQSNNTRVMNVSAAHNENDGISLYYCTNTTIMNVSTALNNHDGITLHYSTNTTIMNVSTALNNHDGITLHYCTNTTIMNVSTALNKHDGITLDYSTNTTIMNVSTALNKHDGISLYYSTDTSMTHVSAAFNDYDGIHSHNSTDTYILKLVFYECGHINTSNTYIANTASLITVYDSTNIVLNGTLFTNLNLPSLASTTSDPTSLPAVITLYSSSLTITDCSFTRNKISSIKATSSNVTMSGKVLFHNNTASLGTVLISAKNSLLIITDYSNIQFQNNRAINYGGVFYIDTEESYQRTASLQDIIEYKVRYKSVGSLITSRTACFVHVEGSRSHARFTFINNTAGRGGDVLYGELVALGYDGDWNCLLSFKNVSNMSQQSGLSLISSTPSRVCLCNETGQLDCLTVADPTTRNIYPGQTITIPAVVIGKDFGTATGSVFAQFLHTPHTTDSVDMEPRHSIAVEHSQCSNLEYTIFSQNEESEAVLVLTHDNREISRLMNKEDNQEISKTWDILGKEPNYKTLGQDIICDFIYFPVLDGDPEFTIQYNESNQPGNRTIKDFYKFTAPIIVHPPLFYSAVNRENCILGSVVQTNFVFPKEIYSYPVYINISFHPCPPGFSLSKHPPFRCDCNQLMQQLPGVKCHIQDQTISRSGLVWIGSDGNETVAASNCPFNYCNREEIDMTLEDPDSQCNFNHSGTLCGGCQPGFSLALGSNRCMNCSNTNLALLLPFALAGCVLVCFIKVIDLTIPQGTLNGLIFYANIVQANEYLLFNEKQTNPLTVFIAWLNLDLGIETCFFNGLTAYGKTWLQFVFPFYIWSIAGLIIILAKYSDKVAKVMGNNSVPVLATLFFLSYAKLFHAIITSLSFTNLSITHGGRAVWSADGNLDYLGPEHAPLFVVAAATLLFLWLPYTLLLLLGQWMHRFNCHLFTRIMIKIKPFLDAHYGPLNGNHRYWFGALLLMKAAILLISALISQNRTIIAVYSITMCALVLTGFSVSVYKSLAVVTFNAVWFVNLGILSVSYMFTTFTGGNFSIASNCLFGLAFAQFIGLVFFKVLVIIKRSERVMTCLRRGEPAVDDLELYEQAALQREMESDNEGGESEESGSIESLPTYGF